MTTFWGEITMEIQQIKTTVLFRGMTDEDIVTCLKELHAKEKTYTKGALILHAGTTTDRMGLVLSGSVTIESNDVWGNRTILSHVGKGQLFAETYSLFSEEPLLVDVTANESSRILFLKNGETQMLHIRSFPWAMQYMTNILAVSARKNLVLSGRSFHTAPKTIRGRVLSYLNSVSLRNHQDEFDIPFDRQQLADYLNLERSALSKELGKMQRDGLITVRKNHFRLHLLPESAT